MWVAMLILTISAVIQGALVPGLMVLFRFNFCAKGEFLFKQNSVEMLKILSWTLS